jgi:hypothetical protein
MIPDDKGAERVGPPYEPKDIFGRRVYDLPRWGDLLSVVAGFAAGLALWSFGWGLVAFLAAHLLLPRRPAS